MGGQHSRPAAARPACGAGPGPAVPGPAAGPAEGLGEDFGDQLEVVLVRQGCEAWGISWNVDADDAHRLVVAGVSPGSAVGRWRTPPAAGAGCAAWAAGTSCWPSVGRRGRSAAPRRGAARLPLRGRRAPRGRAGREGGGGLDGRGSAAAAPPRCGRGVQASRRRSGPEATPGAEASPRQEHVRARQRRQRRAERQEHRGLPGGEDHPVGPVPGVAALEGGPAAVARGGARAGPRPAPPDRPHGRGEAGGEAGADSPWTSDYGSARSAPSADDDGSVALAAGSAAPSCPSTDWEFGVRARPAAHRAGHPAAAFPAACPAGHPAAHAAAYPEGLQPAAARLGSSVEDPVEDDIFQTSEDDSAGDVAVGGARWGRGGGAGRMDALKAMESDRCRDLLQPADAPWALSKGGAGWDTDESTTVANSSLAQRRTRRAGKRARHRPCHMRGKEAAAAEPGAGDAEGCGEQEAAGAPPPPAAPVAGGAEGGAEGCGGRE
ncbi:unnamed protein product, partial [Prorocentrum cordatum]